VITPDKPLPAPPALGELEAKLAADGRLAIDFKAGESGGIEQVLNAVRAAGIGIKDLSIREPDLEDVFLALTYGADKPAA
jgi:ABC-2 type transport system ATP-binding protein